ncbi:unnamed protein product [Allacma fusca]|uniref:Uncharacterized protein n=1 Tax=Allacma fusca TaxID=39272 RepID=A0A8J2JTJ4_9HEXA|nr:unnamed protein product [Allacma fusca]
MLGHCDINCPSPTPCQVIIVVAPIYTDQGPFFLSSCSFLQCGASNHYRVLIPSQLLIARGKKFLTRLSTKPTYPGSSYFDLMI